MDEKLLELLSLLKSETIKLISKLEEVKKIKEANPLDNKIKVEIEALQERVAEIESFKNRLEDKVLDIAVERVENYTDQQLEVQIEAIHNSARTAIAGMQDDMDKAIITNLIIDKIAFDQAESCIKALNLSFAAPDGLPKMILDKFVTEGKKILVSVIPFAEETIQLTQTLFPMPEIAKPNLDAATMLTLTQKLIDGTSKEFAISNLLGKNLLEWVDGIYKSDLPLREQVMKLTIFTKTLSKANIESDMDFANKANNMLVVAIQELFQKAKVTVIQWCANADGFNTPDPNVPIKTSFTKNDSVNQIILDTIAKIGVPVTSTGALRPEYLKQVFPQIVASDSVIYMTHPSYEKNPAGELSDYTKKTPGEQYTDKLIEMRDKKSWEEKLKQKEEEAWAKAMAVKAEKEMKELQRIYNEQKEEHKEEIKERVVNDKPYGTNSGMEFQLGKVYDIGATFGVRERDKWGNLDVEAATERIKEFVGAIKKLNPKKIIYSAFLDNSHSHDYNDQAVYTGLSQFHDTLRFHTGLSFAKDLEYKRIYLLNSQAEVAKSRLGRFLEFQ